MPRRQGLAVRALKQHITSAQPATSVPGSTRAMTSTAVQGECMYGLDAGLDADDTGKGQHRDFHYLETA